MVRRSRRIIIRRRIRRRRIRKQIITRRRTMITIRIIMIIGN